MNTNSSGIQVIRKYLPMSLKIEKWKDLAPFYSELLSREIKSTDDLKKWLIDLSEFEAAIEEDAAWRYIRTNCNTKDDAAATSFEIFLNEIEPHISENQNKIEKKLIECPFTSDLTDKAYIIMLRSVRRAIELYREENIPLKTELQTKEQEYGRLTGSMTVEYEGKELTIQQASNYLKVINRDTRHKVYDLVSNRYLKEVNSLNDLMTDLIARRTLIAKNTGYSNYRDYRFAELNRFDYGVDDCLRFHETVAKEVLPIVSFIQQAQKKSLNIDTLRPWDLQVDPELKPPLKPFDSIEELIDKSIQVFTLIKPEYGEHLKIMKENGYLDLDSRIGKAPGGFNYPLHESNIPFIFMNATHNLRDLETMMHEGGHAVHAFLSKDLELVSFKDAPAEIAELASMSMELMGMEYWDVFFKDKDDLRRAKRSQLEGVMTILPWIVTVDKFQHWLYMNPNHTSEERMAEFASINHAFSSSQTDWGGYEETFKSLWQRQLHIFQIPFYYIEYAIAQLGAIAVWRNFKLNKEKAIQEFETALKLGYTRSIPEVYAAAGIRFDFSAEYVRELMDFVKEELSKLT